MMQHPLGGKGLCAGFRCHTAHIAAGDMQSPPPSAYGPRYPSYNGAQAPQTNSMYQPVPAGLSPLNPSQQPPLPGQAQGRGYKTDSRYSSYSTNQQSAGAGQHPLSNAFYADSSPTLHGSVDDLAKKEKDAFNSSQGSDPSILPYSRSDSAFKRFSGAFINGKRYSDEPVGATAMKPRKRLGYLDGLKFIAAWVVLNGTLFDAAVPNNVRRTHKV